MHENLAVVESPRTSVVIWTLESLERLKFRAPFRAAYHNPTYPRSALHRFEEPTVHAQSASTVERNKKGKIESTDCTFDLGDNLSDLIPPVERMSKGSTTP